MELATIESIEVPECVQKASTKFKSAKDGAYQKYGKKEFEARRGEKKRAWIGFFCFLFMVGIAALLLVLGLAPNMIPWQHDLIREFSNHIAFAGFTIGIFSMLPILFTLFNIDTYTDQQAIHWYQKDPQAIRTSEEKKAFDDPTLQLADKAVRGAKVSNVLIEEWNHYVALCQDCQLDRMTSVEEAEVHQTVLQWKQRIEQQVRAAKTFLEVKKFEAARDAKENDLDDLGEVFTEGEEAFQSSRALLQAAVEVGDGHVAHVRDQVRTDDLDAELGDTRATLDRLRRQRAAKAAQAVSR